MPQIHAPGIGSEITAVLGPTNTGKTHRCVERLLSHETGMLGLPLRLLAREVFDRLVEKVGERHVALITGEEKRAPRGARYWICTVEAMPLEREVDFLAVDEIQLMAHPTRGHVFTQRLLRARGRKETWFLGSDSCRDLIRQLVPTARIETYRRFSQLRYAGQSTLAQLPERTAAVGFTVPQVYALAERIRGKKGGAAVVLGALSPKTRNAQVAMFQAGEVGYLVATDAIGMGLNMNVNHVAFAALRKFDGRKQRSLSTGELSQIAGRAGRHTQDGTFGTLQPCPSMNEDYARAIELHQIERLRTAFYRNDRLDFSSLAALDESLGLAPPHPALRQMPEVDDQRAFRQLTTRADIRSAVGRDNVETLWQVCQIPDYRKLLPEAHTALLGEVFLELQRSGSAVSDDWMARQTEGLSVTTGDLETLTLRLSFVRTFAYLSQHEHWLKDARHWQARTRELENSISDEVHTRLIQRFVARERTRRAPQNRPRATSRAQGAEAPPAAALSGPFAKLAHLAKEMARTPTLEGSNSPHAAGIEQAPARDFSVDPAGTVSLAGQAVAKLLRGTALHRPRIAPLALPEHSQQVLRRLSRLATELPAELELPLPPSARRSGAARGIIYQLNENLGTVSMRKVRTLSELLTAAESSELQALGVRFGVRYVWVQRLLKARAMTLRLAFCGAVAPALRTLGLQPERISLRNRVNVSPALAARFGFGLMGRWLVRCDVAERALNMHAAGANPAALASVLGCRQREVDGAFFEELPPL